MRLVDDDSPEKIDIFSEQELEELFTDIFSFLYLKNLRKQGTLKRAKRHDERLFAEDNDRSEGRSSIGFGPRSVGFDPDDLSEDGLSSNYDENLFGNEEESKVPEIFETGVDFFKKARSNHHESPQPQGDQISEGAETQKFSFKGKVEGDKKDDQVSQNETFSFAGPNQSIQLGDKTPEQTPVFQSVLQPPLTPAHLSSPIRGSFL